MSYWSIGLYRTTSGKLATVYVRSDGTPNPSEQAKVGDGTVLHFGKYRKAEYKYSEARQKLVEEAQALGIATEEEAQPRPKPAPRVDNSLPVLNGRHSKTPRPTVVAWARQFWHLATANGLTRQKQNRTRKRKAIVEDDWTKEVFSDQLCKLAALTASVGPIESEEARRVHYALGCLFLERSRLSRWARALDLLPPNPAVLINIANHVQAYDTEVRDNQLKTGKYKLDQVLAVMLEINEPVVYLKHVVAGGLVHPGAIYHPNTLQAARGQLRGLLGRRAESAAQHAEQVRTKVKIVRD